jgi:hypothetical protein
MHLRSEIENMYSEIINYNGNFGDPIATEFSFKPYDVLTSTGIESFSLCGAGIGLLVDFAVYCDNNCYESALSSYLLDQIKDVLSRDILKEYPDIVHALKCAIESEEEYNRALMDVYKNRIISWSENA